MTARPRPPVYADRVELSRLTELAEQANEQASKTHTISYTEGVMDVLRYILGEKPMTADLVDAIGAGSRSPSARPAPEDLHEKCDHCHLFVELSENDDSIPDDYMHLHRGDEVDTLLDQSHEARPSGRIANLLAWKTYGPLPMRERFTE